MKITFFDNGFGVLYIAYAGRYDFVRPIAVASSLEALEKEVKDYLTRISPLFPITGEYVPSEVISLVSSHSLLAIRGGRVLFNFDELRFQSWYLVKSKVGGEEPEESESAFVSFVVSDLEWNKNELSDLKERLKDFAASLGSGSDWFLSEEE